MKKFFLLSFIFILISSNSYAAIVQQQKKEVESAVVQNSFGLAYTNPVSVGNLLFAVVRVGATPTSATSCSDSVNGAWSIAYQGTDTTNGRTLTVCYFANTAAGTPTVTASWTNTDSNPHELEIFEYSGMATASVVDGTPASLCPTTATNAPNSGNVTTTNANDLFVGSFLLGTTDVRTLTEDAAFTTQLSDTIGTTAHSHLHSGDRIVSATEIRAYQPTLTGTAAVLCIGLTAFKGISASGVIPKMSLLGVAP